MAHQMRKQGQVLREAIQMYSSLPHLPWEQIIPAIPFAAHSAGQLARPIAQRTISPVIHTTAGFGKGLASRGLRHVFALPAAGMPAAKPLTGLRAKALRLAERWAKFAALRRAMEKTAITRGMREVLEGRLSPEQAELVRINELLERGKARSLREFPTAGATFARGHLTPMIPQTAVVAAVGGPILLAESLRRKREEKSREKAAAELPKERQDRIERLAEKRPSDSIKKKLLEVKPDGTKVMEVSGPEVRNNFDTDFALGGHSEVYPYIPDDEVWVEQSPDELVTAQHETEEKGEMAEGKPYEEAHEDATDTEEVRREPLLKAAAGWVEIFITPPGKEPVSVFAEHVTKPEDLRRGLMFRTKMRENEGMLFDSGRRMVHSLWMKNTFLPLDMLFIRREDDGMKVVGIVHEAAPLTEEPRGVSEASDFALEVPGGFCKKRGIVEGSEVQFGTRKS